MKASVPYIEEKWGIRVGDFKDKNKLNCKSIEGINLACRVGFATPFNDSSVSLSNWTLRPSVAERITNAKFH